MADSRLLTPPNEDLALLLMQPHAAPNHWCRGSERSHTCSSSKHHRWDFTATASFKTRSLGLWDILTFQCGFMQHEAAVNSVSSSRSRRLLGIGLSGLLHGHEKQILNKLRHAGQSTSAPSPHADHEPLKLPIGSRIFGSRLHAAVRHAFGNLFLVKTLLISS